MSALRFLWERMRLALDRARGRACARCGEWTPRSDLREVERAGKAQAICPYCFADEIAPLPRG